MIESEGLATMIKSRIVIEEDFISIAKDLMLSLPGPESVFKKITVRTVQVFLYLKLYNTYSPELNDESTESSIAISVLSQYTRIIGGNRDPSTFPNLFTTDVSKNIWRRIYYKILSLDAQNSYQFGSPLIIADEFDVELPKLNEETSKLIDNFNNGLHIDVSGKDLKNIIIEKTINSDIALEYEVTKFLRQAVSMCHSLSGQTKKSEFQTLINNIESFLQNKLPAALELMGLADLQGSMTVEDPIAKIFNIPKVIL
ncbi:unnamed protein product [Ambrosiozyma monospora]|uniref:Unnamed protein product n=1 Tax=Ambrosiozyma monospora TaxID=43982 RepID=A0ACB5TBJ2_AMBMO|nr:unnamed protein product [Ambrosiozyma monospora]